MFFSPNCSSSCLQNLRITQKIRKNNQSNSAWMFSLSVCWWSWIGFGTCVMFWIWKKWCIVCSSGKAICFSAFLTIYYPPYPYLGLGSTFLFLPFFVEAKEWVWSAMCHGQNNDLATLPSPHCLPKKSLAPSNVDHFKLTFTLTRLFSSREKLLVLQQKLHIVTISLKQCTCWPVCRSSILIIIEATLAGYSTFEASCFSQGE